jgi:hypothetical protein
VVLSNSDSGDTVVTSPAFAPGYTLDLNRVVWANGPQTLRVVLG